MNVDERRARRRIGLVLGMTCGIGALACLIAAAWLLADKVGWAPLLYAYAAYALNIFGKNFIKAGFA